jgi:thiamine biosynthesis lipoprotein
MTSHATLRRARPALGTLVEMGARIDASGPEAAEAALAEAWTVLARVERALSAFDRESDIGRFNAAPAGSDLSIAGDTATVLRAAAELRLASDGLFDVSQGTGSQDWWLSEEGGGHRLHKQTADVRLDLGGIGKGHAVDQAFEALASALARALAREAEVACWVNAGGDLRVTGAELPVHLRDEQRGGARPWLVLREGALATSHFGPGARARLTGGPAELRAHVSVASSSCLWSDALTKVVAGTGRVDHPLLARHGATAWLHPAGAGP